MEDAEFDVVIIGAGLSGIAFARFYLDTHPHSRLRILEKDSTIGGVWSKARVFDKFWTQSPLRMTSFSDVPLDLPSEAPNLHDTFEAKYVTQYLEAYVDNHVYQGKPLRDRIDFDAEVTSAKQGPHGWNLIVTGSKPRCIRSKRLAVASGLTSLPNLPDFFARHPDWTVPVLHHRDFGLAAPKILADKSVYKDIAVLGGGKSAADMVYACVKAGKNVSWIIRTTGEGPGIFMNPAASGRYRNNAEAGATRNAGYFNPSGFHTMAWPAQLLHQPELGRVILDQKLFAADRRYKAWANYGGRPGASSSFHRLEPTASFFWNSGPVGMIQHADFWDLISRKVKVYRSDPTAVLKDSIIFDNGTRVSTDVVLCGTGWNAAYPFLSSEQVRDLGLPHPWSHDSPTEALAWHTLMDDADTQIVTEFPILADPPPRSRRAGAASNLTPARLYQGIAPMTDSSIVFLGRSRVSNNFRTAEAQAVWATAYWDGNLELPSFEEMRRHIACMDAFSRRRYPSRGVDGVNFHTDLVWYTDQLLCEAGLFSHRRGWWDDPDEPCLASDLKDCTSEYLAKYGSQKK